MNDKNKYSFYLEQVKDMTLEVLHNDNFCKAFMLKKYPDRTIMSTIILFVCGQIIITGDLRIDNRGLISDSGYGLDWFASRLDANYLASKFLETTWVKEYATEYWEWQLEEHRKERDMQVEQKPDDEEWTLEFPYCPADWLVAGEHFDNVTILDALEKMIEHIKNDGDVTADWIYENQPAYKKPNQKNASYVTFCDGSDGFGGYGYVPAKVGWLYAIQSKFAELYSKLKGAENVSNKS